MAEKDPAESGRGLHVTTLLVASRRALDNALAELGFAEDDDRVVEHDGRLAFLTCSHEEDCDDMFALITELSARGESWELQSRIDAGWPRDLPVLRALSTGRSGRRRGRGRAGAGEFGDARLRHRNPRRVADPQTHPEADRAGRRVRNDPAGPRRPRHRPRIAAELAPRDRGGDRCR